MMAKRKSINWTTAIIIAIVIIVIFQQYQPSPREGFVEERNHLIQYVGEKYYMQQDLYNNSKAGKDYSWVDILVTSTEAKIGGYTFKTIIDGWGYNTRCMADPSSIPAINNEGTKSYIDDNGCQHWSGVERYIYDDCASKRSYPTEMCVFNRANGNTNILSEACQTSYRGRISNYHYEYGFLEKGYARYYNSENKNTYFERLICSAPAKTTLRSRGAVVHIENEDYGGLIMDDTQINDCWYKTDVYLNGVLDHSTGWTRETRARETLIDPSTGLNMDVIYNSNNRHGGTTCRWMEHEYYVKFDEGSFGFDIGIPETNVVQSNTQSINMDINNLNTGSIKAKLSTTYKVPIKAFGDEEYFIKTIDGDVSSLNPGVSSYSYDIPAEQIIDTIIVEPKIELFLPKTELSGLNAFHCTDNGNSGGDSLGPLKCAPEYIPLGSIVDDPHIISVSRMPQLCVDQGITDFIDCKNYLIEYYDQLNLGLDELQAIIEQLTQTQAEKMELISKLQLTLDEQKKLIDQFQITIDEQAEYIKQLNLTIKEQAELIISFELTVEEQAAYINDLDLTVKEQAELINQLTENLATKAALVNQLTAENEKQAELIAEMKLSFSNQGVILSQLENTVADDAIIIADLTDNVDEQAEIIDNMKLTNEEQASLISELYDNIKDQTAIIKKMKLTNEEQARIINRLAKSNEEMNEYINDLELLVDQQQRLLDELQKLPDPSETTVDKYLPTTSTESGTTTIYILILLGFAGFIGYMFYTKRWS